MLTTLSVVMHRDAAEIIQGRAIRLASEAIQVAAMAKKFLESFEDEEKVQ